MESQNASTATTVASALYARSVADALDRYLHSKGTSASLAQASGAEMP